MKNFIIELYNELIHNITWTKWKELQHITLIITICIIVFSLILYLIDYFFIWIIQKIFSIV
ncbi:MAG: preprotein translocase subunit SecE [Candidatus Bostrichicola ureolyticus]|nr:MAG: preprotein translocase subunit SecE [Candidatus Bostrichicola ureolyticus]